MTEQMLWDGTTRATPDIGDVVLMPEFHGPMYFSANGEAFTDVPWATLRVARGAAKGYIGILLRVRGDRADVQLRGVTAVATGQSP